MATAKYGIAVEWAKHLRPLGRRKFWKKVREQAKKVIREGSHDTTSAR